MDEKDRIPSLINAWKKIFIGEHKSWVLFENGTCIILTKPEEDLEKQALEIMKKWGPVYIGTPAADFSIIDLKDDPGWLVTSHYPDMLTYVSPKDISKEKNSDVYVGLIGRHKRNEDAKSLKIVHIEDKRGNSEK